MTTYSEGGHELGNYWLGQEVASPGAAFYLATLLWRLTPFDLAWPTVRPYAGREAGNGQAGRRERETWGAMLLFVLWFGVIISLGDKKFDRYLLPIFPAVDLLAAMGWVWLGGRFIRRPGRPLPGCRHASPLRSPGRRRPGGGGPGMVASDQPAGLFHGL